MPSRVRRRVALLVVAATLLMAACGGARTTPVTGGDASGAPRPSGQATAPSAGNPDPTDAPESTPVAGAVTAEALEAAGLTAWDPASGASRPTAGSPLTYSPFQLRSLAAGAMAGVGLTGAELDRWLPLGPLDRTISSIVWAWATGATPASDTGGGRLARAILAATAGSRDLASIAPADAMIPDAVLALFVDAVLETAGPGTAASDPRVELAALRAPIADVCPVSDALAESLRLALLRLVATPDLSGLLGAFEIVADPTLAVDSAMSHLTSAIWTLGMLTQARAFLAGATLAVSADPDSERFAIGSEPDRGGTLTAMPATKLDEWPYDLWRCGALGLGAAPLEAGDPAVWWIDGRGQGRVTLGADADGLDGALVTQVAFTTGREPAGVEADPIRTHDVVVQVRTWDSAIGKALEDVFLSRDTVKAVVLIDFPTGSIRPTEIATTVESFLGPLERTLRGDARDVVDGPFTIRGRTVLTITDHEPRIRTEVPDPCRYLRASDIEALSVSATLDSTPGSGLGGRSAQCGYLFRNPGKVGSTNIREARGVLTLSVDELGGGGPDATALPELGEDAEVALVSAFYKNGFGTAGTIIRFRAGPYWALLDLMVDGTSGDYADASIIADAVELADVIQERVLADPD